ncbi:MAG: hypothetical protein KG075_10010 [Alphaproteobacteria bacterium]|nr:hypothetical protein [Alphaproteobacteria bacterium]
MEETDTALIEVIRGDLKSLSAKSDRLESQRTLATFLIILASATTIVLYLSESSAWIGAAVLSGIGVFGWVHNFDRDKYIQRQIAETENRLSAAGYGVKWADKATEVDIFIKQKI